MTHAGAGLGTQTDVMAQAAGHVSTVRSDIDAQLASLRTRLQALPELWHGPASRAFVAATQRCDADGRALAEALGGIGDQLRASGAAYQATEDEQQAAVLRQADAATSGISDALRRL